MNNKYTDYCYFSDNSDLMPGTYRLVFFMSEVHECQYRISYTIGKKYSISDIEFNIKEEMTNDVLVLVDIHI